MKVLWIAGWYPNQTEPFAGDFVQRHAQAVSLYHDVTVIFITRDALRTVTDDTTVEEFVHGRLRERKVYYDVWGARIPVAGRMASYLKYQALLRAEIKRYISANGRPDLIHFYIGMRSGVSAKWIDKTGIPYVMSEQWTGFLAEGQPNFNDLPALFRKGWISLADGAAGIHVVSGYLGNALERLTGKQLPLKMIPNVVNTCIFFPVKRSAVSDLKLVYITSQLAWQKNTKDILHALAILKRKGVRFRLDIFGPLQDEYKQLAGSLDINTEVMVHGEKSQQELAEYFAQADALIIYSRFETFGCVIIEANACGTPVVASDIPVLHENIREGLNGTFAASEDPAALAARLEWLAGNPGAFQREEIAIAAAAGYNYEKVGKMFSDWYNEIQAKKK